LNCHPTQIVEATCSATGVSAANEFAQAGPAPAAVPVLARRLRKVVFWTFMVVAFLVSAEITCRVDDWIRLGVPVYTTPNHEHDLTVKDRFGVRDRPHGRFRGWQPNYRRFGFPGDRLPTLVRQAAMFLLVVIGWVFFRAEDFPMAAALLRARFVPTPDSEFEGIGIFAVLLAVAAWWAMAGPNAFDLHVDRGWKRRYGFA
jgi:hypothetical protein